jgi:hypothetical protein
LVMIRLSLVGGFVPVMLWVSWQYAKEVRCPALVVPVGIVAARD